MGHVVNDPANRRFHPGSVQGWRGQALVGSITSSCGYPSSGRAYARRSPE
jgi:hypothetical protein